jgi:hypothetical protein
MATLGTTSKPAYVYDTETDTWVPIGVGAHTHALTSADVSGVVAQSGYFAAGKNLVHNGNFAISQKGVPYSGLTAGAYNGPFDRWYCTCVANSAAITISRENDAPANAGVRQSLKYLFTTANTTLTGSERVFVSQKFEGQFLNQIEKGTSSAKEVTLSFWVKSNVTGTYNVTFIDNTNSRGFTGQYTINASATWEKKTILVPADTTGAFANDTSAAFEARFWQVAGTNYSSGSVSSGWIALSGASTYAPGQVNVGAATNNYWQITAVQLEIGSTASSFALSAGTPAAELQLCQRYFISYGKNQGDSTLANALGPTGVTTSTTEAVNTYTFPVKMRAIPTLTFAGSANLRGTAGLIAVTGASLGYGTSTQMATVGWTVSSGLTAGQWFIIRQGSGAGDALVEFSSEI